MKKFGELKVGDLIATIRYAHIMSYEQFIFALPQIWYTTLFRIIQEWEAEYPEAELAY